MNSRLKEILKQSIILDDDEKFIETLDNINLELDETYFDYDLLKVALYYERGNIANILINEKGCRVQNNKVHLEETPLHLAMKLGDVSVISAILKKNASIYDKNLQGDTPLHAAFKESHYNSVNVVLDYISNCNFSFNPENKDDILHFHIACIRKHINSVKLYLSLGFDFNSYLRLDLTEISGLIPLQYLMSKNDYSELFQNLLEHSFDELVLDESFLDYELLKAALVNKHVIIANFLIRKGCRVRNPSKTNLEETPLHLAMKLEDLSFISAILNNNASIYDKNFQGDTPLHAAFKERYYSSVNVVLDYIANCNLSFNPDNKDDILHFHIACIRNHIASVKLFLSLGFDVNSYLTIDSAEFSDLTPLHYLVSKRDYGNLFKILLDRSDLNIKNSNGLTPLHSIYYNDGDQLYDEYRQFSSKFCAILDQIFRYGNDTKFINAVDNNSVSHFHLCCTTDVDFVKVFIDNGVDVNSTISLNCSFNAGFTPLHFAVKNSCLHIVELLLKSGADCNRSDKNGRTPLHFACANYENEDAAEIIEMLLDYAACPVDVDGLGRTPIHVMFSGVAYEEGTELTNRIKILNKLTKFLKVNLTDPDGLSFFHIICTRNEPGKVEDFLNSGAAIDSCVLSGMFEGYTALHFAVLFHQKDVVEVLLKRNAQVNVIANFEVGTPLHLACQCTHFTFCETYCEYEKKCQANDNKPVGIDGIFDQTRQIDIIRLLLLYGADVEAKNDLNFTPLFSAFEVSESLINNWSEFGNDIVNEVNARLIEITNLLLSNKANINGCNKDELTIFHMIGGSGLPMISDALMECLLTAGADINAVDKYGYTPLHCAAISCKNELVQTFLKHKANVNAKLKNFETPLKCAIEKFIFLKDLQEYEEDIILCKSSQSCIKILLENRSNVNVKAPDGRSLLHDAVSCSSAFLIENLLNHGADINVEDLSGNSLVCSLLMNGEINEINISCIIFMHVQKLLALRLFVNDKVQKFCYYLLQYVKNLESKSYYNSIRDGFDRCVNELNTMEMIKIDNYSSLHSILLKDSHELSKHMRNKSFIEILEAQDIDETFPLYNYLLKLQYKKGLLRSEVLKDAKRSLIYIVSSNLPELCYDSILRYLNNEEIVNLKAAAAGKAKRKLSDNCSNETEPSIKLLKS